MLSNIPPVLPILKAPGLIPPTVAGPKMIKIRKDLFKHSSFLRKRERRKTHKRERRKEKEEKRKEKRERRKEKGENRKKKRGR